MMKDMKEDNFSIISTGEPLLKKETKKRKKSKKAAKKNAK